ncbi:unnamed protein product [Mucor hiemalis]
MAQPNKAQQQNKGNNKSNSTFVKKRNQNGDIPISASKIKKRIRDVKRTLDKGKHVSAQVVTESKRRLRVLEFELGEKIIDEYERGNATKYHAVKHFERKKAERKLKQAAKSLNSETDESKKEALQEKVNNCQINLYYVQHFPKTVHYVSLYPKENGNDPKSSAKREAILKDIKEAVASGDKDFKLMNKRYRSNYKEKLIEKGLIQPVAPIDEEADSVMKDGNSDDESSSDSSDEKDDFFEKA